jgi:hypothetical protein
MVHSPRLPKIWVSYLFTCAVLPEQLANKAVAKRYSDIYSQTSIYVLLYIRAFDLGIIFLTYYSIYVLKFDLRTLFYVLKFNIHTLFYVLKFDIRTSSTLRLKQSKYIEFKYVKHNT